MRARYKGPSGTGILELPDDATVQALFTELQSKSGVTNFVLKYGPPMAMQTLDLSRKDDTAKALGLHGETLTIVPSEPRPLTPPPRVEEASKQQPSADAPISHPKESASKSPDEICVPWPDRDGTLLLRVMPSDNSCLFTAFGGAVQENHSAQDLRRMMADYISKNSHVYTEAVLGSPPSQYCRSIQDPDRWGGGIELSILSDIFNIQICTYDVQAQNLIKFGEDKDQRCILVYSGIHYDRVVFGYTAPPYDVASSSPEADITKWLTTDDEVLDKAQELVRALNKAHYYTDTEGLILKCDVPGCNWIGSGQLEGRKHAEQTGHVQLSEIRDTEEDNTLRKCDAPGCSFMGQGLPDMNRHQEDTGHRKFSIIPDW
ncbi:hypothetical protein S40285_08041 [Stachybotrys chlorohalonatus IBT 40285]|uniref:Ubiquitin thioesterase OTU n=1 Tax=Stachybotrys chlorohalonatus (strain IBT 40285) TaxID=1283841 RepID=A0A084Q8I1_STAC4|nr:hypothetical protein S40285_08041 [Stachybotrys chlorohalonata IBT 40285]